MCQNHRNIPVMAEVVNYEITYKNGNHVQKEVPKL